MYPQCVGDEEQVSQLHLVSGFHALDCRPVDAGGVSKGLLSEVLVEASHADVVADRAAGRGDPLGQIGWHPANVLRTMIIRQQQI